MATAFESLPDTQYRFGAPYRDTDQESYFACSIASSNETADDLPGAGRTLGKFYSVAGRFLERRLGSVAEKIGYGPRATMVRIHRQRLITASKHLESRYCTASDERESEHWRRMIDQIDQIDPILRNSRLLDMSESHYRFLRDFSSRLPSSKEEEKVEKYCKRLLKYVRRSNVESTKRQALDYIIELAFEDQYIRELLVGMGAVNVMNSFRSDPGLWINCGASLQSSSRKALLVLNDAEVHTLALKFQRYSNYSDNENRDVCLQALKDYLQDPTYSFVAVRYLRQLSLYLKYIMDPVVIDIAQAIYANCDIVEFEECDRILTFWMDLGFSNSRIDECSAVLEVILRYAEKLPRTVNSDKFQEWCRDLESVNASRTQESLRLHAHYRMAVLLKGIAALKRLGDTNLRAGYSHPRLQPLLHLLVSSPDIMLSKFANKYFSNHQCIGFVPGPEELKSLCNELTRIYASSTDNQIRERAWHCVKVLLISDIYCHTAMLEALSLPQIRCPTDLGALVEEVKRLDYTPIYSDVECVVSIRHCDAEGRFLHIMNHAIYERCDSTRGCVMEQYTSYGRNKHLMLRLERGTAFSSTGHHPFLAGHTADGEETYLAEAHFSHGFCTRIKYPITEGTTLDDLRILTRKPFEDNLEERTPISLELPVLPWVPDMYAKSTKYAEEFRNIGFDPIGPFSWKPLEGWEFSRLPMTEAHISDLDTESELEITFAEEVSTDEEMDLPEGDKESSAEESGTDDEDWKTAEEGSVIALNATYNKDR